MGVACLLLVCRVIESFKRCASHWDTRVFNMEEISVGLFFLSLSFTNIGDRFCWMFIGVYGLMMMRVWIVG